MTTLLEFDYEGCEFMDEGERQWLTGQMDRFAEKIERRFDSLDTKIDTLHSGHAELDKNLAVTASQLTAVQGSVARLGERMGKAEVALATTQGADQGVQVQQSKQFNWTSLIITALLTAGGIIVTILLTGR